MRKTPLFPNARKGFYSYSGLVDVHFRPAMRGRLAGTVTHALRVAGINDFIAWVEGQPLPRAEKEREKAKFAVHMGWRAPDLMLEYYSAPHRRAQVAALVAQFASVRGDGVERLAKSPEAMLREHTGSMPQRGPISTFDKMMLLSAKR
jgi:hypothetical protein